MQEVVIEKKEEIVVVTTTAIVSTQAIISSPVAARGLMIDGLKGLLGKIKELISDTIDILDKKNFLIKRKK